MTNREENITPSEPPHHGMKKDFYNQHSTTQSSAISLCTQLLVKAAQEVPLQDHISSHPLQVAEWGCAHGANSIAPVCLIADVLTQRLAGQGILSVFAAWRQTTDSSSCTGMRQFRPVGACSTAQTALA